VYALGEVGGRPLHDDWTLLDPNFKRGAGVGRGSESELGCAFVDCCDVQMTS